MDESHLIRLHDDDNVFTVAETIPAGRQFFVGGATIVSSGPIRLGFKIAAESIPAGGKVIKYGVPIGSATRDIAIGEPVHTHNMKSDYLPTFTRGEGPRHAA